MSLPNFWRECQELQAQKESQYGVNSEETLNISVFNHEQLAKIWTAQIQLHYRMELPHEIPAELAAAMMAGLKLTRLTKPGRRIDDAYDLAIYTKITDECKQKTL